VIILHGVPDDILATLYAHCLFALYPSFYEGWGLPVSEALSYGKVPAISNTSSLPEAGGTYARYFNPTDPCEIAAVVRGLLNEKTRQEAEAAIRRSYVARPWHEIASDLIAKADALPSRQDERLPNLGGEGRWTFARDARVSRSDQQGVSRNGEVLRHGRGWLFPDQVGCRIEGDDAALRFRWSGGPGASVCIAVSSIGQPGGVDIEMNGETIRHSITVRPDSRIRLSLPSEDADLRIGLRPVTGEILVREMVVLQASQTDC
jgi:RNA polymerase-interacting CarD/CdnL/TRCF family regulator